MGSQVAFDGTPVDAKYERESIAKWSFGGGEIVTEGRCSKNLELASSEQLKCRLEQSQCRINARMSSDCNIYNKIAWSKFGAIEVIHVKNHLAPCVLPSEMILLSSLNSYRSFWT